MAGATARTMAGTLRRDRFEELTVEEILTLRDATLWVAEAEDDDGAFAPSDSGAWDPEEPTELMKGKSTAEVLHWAEIAGGWVRSQNTLPYAGTVRAKRGSLKKLWELVDAVEPFSTAQFLWLHGQFTPGRNTHQGRVDLILDTADETGAHRRPKRPPVDRSDEQAVSTALVGEFVHEACVLRSAQQCTAATFYGAYSGWCAQRWVSVPTRDVILQALAPVAHVSVSTTDRNITTVNGLMLSTLPLGRPREAEQKAVLRKVSKRLLYQLPTSVVRTIKELSDV